MPNASIEDQALSKARQRLLNRGISMQAFAKSHNIHPSTVYAVLSGQNKCLRGEGHRTAILLGIKQAEVTDIGSDSR